MKKNVDQLSMLLSSDWFADKWFLLGFWSDRLCRREMKRRCRQIVEEIFDGEQDYWQASFDDRRVNGTFEKFLLVAKESCLLEHDISRLKLIANGDDSDMSEASLLENLTHLLINDRDQETLRNVTVTLVDKISAIWASFDVGFDFVSESLASTSEWDAWLKTKTPGLPEYLADFSLNVYRKQGLFEKFWGKVLCDITNEEKDMLIAWYRGMAKELADCEISFIK